MAPSYMRMGPHRLQHSQRRLNDRAAYRMPVDRCADTIRE
jgi:hypothetical protein